MDDHPEFVFVMSQAQQLAWIKEHRPEVFARIAEKVAAGQFVPVGGMWVESDTNMPGGEALARQFVHGKRFFLDEFGIETEEVWLPDSFGYTGALPQLVKLSGSQWFLTQKISWNQTNKFPHHTFWWEGIDGTRVFTHFPPVDTYNAELSGRELAHAVRNFRDKGRATRSLVPFGYGDGGGGPTREMLARARRLARPGGLGPGADREAGRVLRQGPGRVPGPAGLGRASCTWSCTAAPTPRRPRPSRATGAASTCCARPSCGRPPPPSGPATSTRTSSWTGCGRRCCCTSSTTSCPARRSPGCTARREATYAAVAARAGGDHRRRPAGAGRARRRGRPSRRRHRLQRRPARARRRPGHGRRAPGGAPAAVDARHRPGGGFVLDNGLLRVVDRRARPGHLGDRPGRRRGRRSPPAPAPTCCSCTPTCRTSGTPGTSTGTTATR